MSIEIRVKGQPPLHQCGVSITSDKHPHKERVQEFVRRAREVMRDKEPLQGNLIMEIEYSGLYPMTDPVNVLCAFPNMFEGIVYRDDNQIREVHCWEVNRGGPECLIRFRGR